MNGAHALAQRLQQRFAPPERPERRALLIGLLVGFREEPHMMFVSIYKFFYGYDEFDIPVRLPFLYREQVKLGEFIRRLTLSEGPFRHSFTFLSLGRGTPAVSCCVCSLVELLRRARQGLRSPEAGVNSRS